MGEPENPEEYVRFDADGVTVYVSRQLLREKVKPGATEMPFYIDGYGRFYLRFKEPWQPET
ncbi:MAG TPA: hypothetical protein ENK08_08455 [Chloroflexi bacterium]|nr:hypothetical protein [Chloroflexota bacterium]